MSTIYYSFASYDLDKRVGRIEIFVKTLVYIITNTYFKFKDTIIIVKNPLDIHSD